MAKSYAILSGKGGAGKTTSAVNLGAAVNNLNKDVILVDANFSTPNLGLYLGSPVVPVSLDHVLRGEANIDEAIYEHKSGIKLVPCSLSLDKKPDAKSMKSIAEKLKKISSCIIFDSAAGLGEEVETAINSVDEIILVVNPNILSVTDALKTIKLAEKLRKPVRGIILNRVKNKKTEMPISQIQEMLEVPLLGIVPEDKHIEKSLEKRDAVIHTKPRSRAAKAYQEIALKLLNKRKPKRFLDFLGL